MNMKKIPQRTLEYNIGLVKYQNPKQKDGFDLTTIHSLLIDQNPKFIQLRQLIVDYNSKEEKRLVNRPNLQRTFIERLYKMLSQVTQMSKSENQLLFLNKIYNWAFKQRSQNENLNQAPQFDEKVRPNTASTKTRPYSAYTKKTRPDSGVPTKQMIPSKKSIQTQQTISNKVMEKYPNVDFTQLKHGEKDFFLGHRTLHPQQERPKIKLKQYQRKVFYDQPDDEQRKFAQFYEQKKPTYPVKQKLKQIPVEQEVVIPEQELKQAQNIQQQNAGGQEAIEGGPQGIAAGEQDVNIDDLVGDQQQAPGQQEQVQVVDKLRPRLKVYGDVKAPIPRNEIQNFNKGIQKQFKQRNALIREVQQDKFMKQIMHQWAQTKNRVKIQQRRRAQSARIMTRNTGALFEKYIKKQENDFNGNTVIDLTQTKVSQIKVGTRPISAITAQSERVQNQKIQDALITGQLNRHINLQSEINSQAAFDKSQRLGTFAAKPKKKTFQQILKQAQDRVNRQIYQQIQQVKQTLTNNKIAMGANKIYKSLSYHEPQVCDGDFVGLITGQGMIKNPFFKVAKKKKKKKKK